MKSRPNYMMILIFVIIFGSAAGRRAKKSETVAPDQAQPTAAMAGLSAGDMIAEGDVLMIGVDGKSASINSVAGAKGTLVIFTCNHCPYVQAWQGRLVPLANEALGKGVGVIAINSNDPKDYPIDGMEGMKERAAQMEMQYPYVVDKGSVVARAFGATRTPEIFLFNAKGELVYQGAVDDNAQDPSSVSETYLADAIDALIAGKALPMDRTRSVGCTIKYWPKPSSDETM